MYQILRPTQVRYNYSVSNWFTLSIQETEFDDLGILNKKASPQVQFLVRADVIYLFALLTTYLQ
jgi:hypothetical protein